MKVLHFDATVGNDDMVLMTLVTDSGMNQLILDQETAARMAWKVLDALGVEARQ